jgi:hypothetical protein
MMIERLKAHDRLIADAEERLSRYRARLREAQRIGMPTADLARLVVVAERFLLSLNQRRCDLLAQMEHDRLTF